MNGIKKSHFHKELLLAFVLLWSTKAFSEVTNSLYAPHGLTRALGNGGSAIVTDLSSVDSNPAGLSLDKHAEDYRIAGDFEWNNSKALSSEIGIVDTSTSEVAAGLKVRKSMVAGGIKGYRYSLGLAEKLTSIPLDVGVAGDLDQIFKDVNSPKKTIFWRLRFGVIYSLLDSLSLGIFSGGYFDKSKNPLVHGMAVAWRPMEYLLIVTDLRSQDFKPSNVSGGIGIFPLEWLDLLLGYEYKINSKKSNGSLEIAVKAMKIRTYYSLQKEDILNKGGFRHIIGLDVSLMGFR